MSNRFIPIVIVAFISAAASIVVFETIRRAVEPPPRPTPFVKVCDQEGDVSFVNSERVTGIRKTPDHSYRYGDNWCTFEMDGEKPDEIRRQWRVAYCGAMVECTFPTEAEADAAIKKTLEW